MTGLRRAARRLRVPLAVACAGVAMLNLAAPAPAPIPAVSYADVETEPLLRPGPPPLDLVEEGERIYLDACSSCHGEDLRGIPGRGPTLRGVGARAADFYLRTNRMPLDDPEDQPSRHPDNVLTTHQKRAVVAFVSTFGGPPIPRVNADEGDVAVGKRLFTEFCAGCHQVVARGGIQPGAQNPDLEGVAALDVAEAIGIGPYVMPEFTHFSQFEVNSIAAYVQYTHNPEDRGGWGIGHIGPVPEGLVTFWLGLAALLLTIRVIGERTTE